MNENLPVAIQVYGLRDLLEETPERFEEVMCSVKEMGYQGVELAGLYGLEPGEVKRILDTQSYQYTGRNYARRGYLSENLLLRMHDTANVLHDLWYHARAG